MRGRLATRGSTSVMNLQAFPGDFLLKFRSVLEPVDSAATTSSTVVHRPISKAGCAAQVGGKTSNAKSAGGISIPQPRLRLTIWGSAGQDLHRRQREADGPSLRTKESDMNINAIWGANVTPVSARLQQANFDPAPGAK